MDVREAVRFKFIHPSADKEPGAASELCHAIMVSTGERCKEHGREALYSRRFCRRHFDAVIKWTSELAFEGKGK